MDRDSMRKLRLDRRLIGRRGWISTQELDSALESLPDVSSKATTLGDAGETESARAVGSEAGEPGSSPGA